MIIVHILPALPFQNHAANASVLMDFKAKAVRSPSRKVRSLCKLVGKGKSREVQRVIQKSKSKVGCLVGSWTL